MKKTLSILLALVLTIGVLAGCGSSASSAGSNAAAGGTNAAADGAAAANIKVGFITLHDENSTYDLNFINAAKAACEQLGVEYLLRTNVPEG